MRENTAKTRRTQRLDEVRCVGDGDGDGNGDGEKLEVGVEGLTR